MAGKCVVRKAFPAIPKGCKAGGKAKAKSTTPKKSKSKSKPKSKAPSNSVSSVSSVALAAPEPNVMPAFTGQRHVHNLIKKMERAAVRHKGMRLATRIRGGRT